MKNLNDYVAKYFFKTKKISEKYKKNQNITMQFFQRNDDVLLCGINEVLKILKKQTKHKKYSIKYLPEGSIIKSKEVVLELEGPYHHFGFLEGVIDGILSRQTSIASNARDVVNVANNKEIIFMGDRADHYINQENDGYAISIGGIKTQVTNAQIKKHNGVAIGTMPHALIQMFEGNLIEALKAYKDIFPDEKLVALVDFNNDVVNDSIKAYNEFKDDLFAVRVDTSQDLIDKMFDLKNKEYGVTPNMIKKLRKSLDEVGAKKVKIIVSSGFNKQKINEFEKSKAPVDFYGVGSSLLKINTQFTADAVKVEEKNIAKVGRKYSTNNKLIKF